MSAKLPHTMLERARWVRALQYAQGLEPGSLIDPAIDGEYVEQFGALLPLALEVHGLRLINGVCERIDNDERSAAE